MPIIDLEKYGIKNVKEVIYNPSYELLFEDEMSENNTGFEKGVLSSTGAVSVMTGRFTGRSPKDRYVVKDKTTEDTIWLTNQFLRKYGMI